MGKTIEKGLDMNLEKQQVNIRRIIEEIEEGIVGRVANKHGDIPLDNLDILLKYVLLAGGGNHLEIGTLFGGSAIAVALMKDDVEQTGIIVCVDPLNGYYSKYDPREDMLDGVSGETVTPEILFKNIEKFDIGHRLLVMKTISKRIPIWYIIFSTAYIDGDHKENEPLRDWFRIKHMVSRYIIFDNCDDGHPDVQEACEVARQDKEWLCVYDEGITCVMERIWL